MGHLPDTDSRPPYPGTQAGVAAASLGRANWQELVCTSSTLLQLGLSSGHGVADWVWQGSLELIAIPSHSGQASLIPRSTIKGVLQSCLERAAGRWNEQLPCCDCSLRAPQPFHRLGPELATQRVLGQI